MFALDPRLENDTISLGNFPLCRLLLMNESSYPWFILVPQRSNLQEIPHLSETDHHQLWHESTRLSLWMERFFCFDKMNIAALGNIVNQLHLHHVARKVGDPAWPNPIWGYRPPVPYELRGIESLHCAVRAEFSELIKVDS